MDQKDKKQGYKVSISEEAVAEALESVSKYENESKAEKEEAVTVEEEDPTASPDAENSLKSQMETAEQKAKDAHERMLRVAADADNIRKRAIKERNDAIKYGQENMLRDFLPVIDNLDRSLVHVPKDSDDPALETLRQGVEMVRHQFVTVLEEYNVKGFDSVGKAFDPALHEAISRQPDEHAEPDTILSEMHRGYMLHDRLLRPALVVVAGPLKTQSASEENQKKLEAEEGCQ
jgi:molecular chaperone GrpE